MPASKLTVPWHLRQRIIHFARLTMIRQLVEIVKETRRLPNRSKSCPVGIHHRPPPATQWMTTDSALQSFVTDIFTRLPCRVALARLIAHHIPVTSLTESSTLVGVVGFARKPDHAISHGPSFRGANGPAFRRPVTRGH